MQRIKPKYIRIGGIVLATLLIIVLIVGYIAYSKREAFLQKELASAEAKAKKDYNLDIKIGSANFTGLNTVSFSDITIVPQDRDSLLAIKKLSVSVKLMPLIIGEVKLGEVTLDDAHLNLTDINKVKNFDFLFKKKKDTTATTSSKLNLADLANNLINQFLYKIPDDLNLKNFLLTYTSDTSHLKLLTTTAAIKNGNLTSTIIVDDGQATWHFAGKMHPSDKDIDVRLYADGKKVELPLIEKRFKTKFSFDTITTRLSKVSHSGGETRIFGSWSISNLLINNSNLSENDIVIPNASIDANVFVGPNYISLDSSSVIHLKKLTANPYVKYTLSPVKIYELKINTGWLNAQDIFDSFPGGTFDSLQGMQVAGKLNYSLNFYLDSSNPDGVQFNSGMDKDHFKILKYGKTDLTMMNRPFMHQPYELTNQPPPFMVGPQNPDFTPLEDIAVDTRNAVMTSEDPSFYTNNGFVEEALRKSIATDFKNKKFTRGGSTISMQLIRNTFLNRDKNLARKVEEILMVWMIENNHLVTKDRMLEVYFNIVEWGYHIYGIGEASRYYFGKTPSQLTLGESIFLASLLPSPKAGLYAFLPDGSLRPGLHGYFNLIGNLMAGHGKAQRDSNAYGFYEVRLKESLRRGISNLDTAKVDSLMQQSNDNDAIPIVEPEKKMNFFQRLFSKKDSTSKTTKKEVKKPNHNTLVDYGGGIVIDTAGKTKKQIRQEKRALKKQQKQLENESKENGGE
jgi:Transglycosylase